MYVFFCDLWIHSVISMKLKAIVKAITNVSKTLVPRRRSRNLSGRNIMTEVSYRRTCSKALL